jgi:spermidine synthase
VTVEARGRSALGELVLLRRDDGHLELRANGVFVMDTREHTSERALASRSLELAAPGPLRVLVGGLGLGFTLAAVLADPRVTRCTVVEIEPDLVGWLRDGTVPHGPPLLADPRVEVVVADIADVLNAEAVPEDEPSPTAYDLVLLDVDNGPGYLVHDANAALYRAPALETARRTLADSGLLVVWSAAPAPELAAALRSAFGNVAAEAFDVPGHGRAGEYWLYTARYSTPPAPPA